MYSNNTLQEPNATIWKLLMGLQRGSTPAPYLSEEQRRHIIGQFTDVNILSWLIKQIQFSNTTHKTPSYPLTTNKRIRAASYPILPPTKSFTITQTSPSPSPYHGNLYTTPISGSIRAAPLKRSTPIRSSSNTLPH